MKFKQVIIVAVGLLALSGLVISYYSFSLKVTRNTQLSEQKKAPHFLDSTPLHNETYAAAPINITINFNFDLGTKSKISVTNDSQEWTDGLERIENNKTTLKKDLKSGLKDGVYLVVYLACWPDQSCHEGYFSFKVDSKKISEYTDMTGKNEIVINMKNILFSESKVIVSPNTKVTWTNLDEVEHFVNTETHPSHTYFLEQNSRGIAKDQNYSTIFSRVGQYNYHCSAHASSMKASIIVQ
jgi:plastocyanin